MYTNQCLSIFITELIFNRYSKKKTYNNIHIYNELPISQHKKLKCYIMIFLMQYLYVNTGIIDVTGRQSKQLPAKALNCNFREPQLSYLQSGFQTSFTYVKKIIKQIFAITYISNCQEFSVLQDRLLHNKWRACSLTCLWCFLHILTLLIKISHLTLFILYSRQNFIFLKKYAYKQSPRRIMQHFKI